MPVRGSMGMEERGREHAKEKRDRIQRLSLQGSTTSDLRSSGFPRLCNTRSTQESSTPETYVLCRTSVGGRVLRGSKLHMHDELVHALLHAEAARTPQIVCSGLQRGVVFVSVRFVFLHRRIELKTSQSTYITTF